MDEIITVISPYSILVHNKSSLKRIYCPFKVKARYPAIEMTLGKFHTVTKVGQKEDEILFLIDELWFQHSMFEIL